MGGVNTAAHKPTIIIIIIINNIIITIHNQTLAVTHPSLHLQRNRKKCETFASCCIMGKPMPSSGQSRTGPGEKTKTQQIKMDWMRNIGRT